MANQNQKALDLATAAGATSPTFKMPSPRVTVQGWLDATGGTAAVAVEVSNDPRAETAPASAAWLTMATIGLTGANNSDGFSQDATWAFMRLRIDSISGGAKVTAYVAN